MWTVDRPDYDVKDTFELCISRIRKRTLRERMNNVTGAIVNASTDYAYNADNQTLHLFPKEDNVIGIVTRDEMISNYDNRFAKKDSPARCIYDAIKLLPDNDTCPFCGNGIVSTLDHILPKTVYPVIAVTPDNLVGCCSDCNKAKLDQSPNSASEVPLHPYFDKVEDKDWLTAEVVEGPIPAVLFHVAYQDDWTVELNSRLANQFNTLDLGGLYSKLAAREISGQKRILMSFFNDGGAQAVREELSRKHDSWKAFRRNCWQSVTFLSLSQSEWFCSTGHAL